MDAGEPALALALCGTDGFNDDWVAHGVKLEHVLALGKPKSGLRVAAWITRGRLVDLPRRMRP